MPRVTVPVPAGTGGKAKGAAAEASVPLPGGGLAGPWEKILWFVTFCGELSWFCGPVSAGSVGSWQAAVAFFFCLFPFDF